jgi:hypothetical protein
MRACSCCRRPHGPIATSDLAAAISRADASAASSTKLPRTVAQTLALGRLREIATEGDSGVTVELSGAARPTTLRTFDDTPREEGEARAWLSGFLGQRWGGRLEVVGVADPDDDKSVRIDGSYFSGKFGNWIVTAGAQERWWGSGYEGSLIMSNNARPVPAISLDRAVSEPFKSKWLHWIGPVAAHDFHGPHGGRP